MKLSDSFYEKRMLQQNGRCYYCGEKLILENGLTHIDHIKPFSKYKDGTRQNLCLACKTCNSIKRDLELINFRELCKLRGIIIKKGKFYFERREILWL